MKTMHSIYSLLTMAALMFSVLVTPAVNAEAMMDCCPPNMEHASAGADAEYHPLMSEVLSGSEGFGDDCSDKSCDITCCGVMVVSAVMADAVAFAANLTPAMTHKIQATYSVLAIDEQRNTPPPKFNIPA